MSTLSKACYYLLYSGAGLTARRALGSNIVVHILMFFFCLGGVLFFSSGADYLFRALQTHISGDVGVVCTKHAILAESQFFFMLNVLTTKNSESSTSPQVLAIKEEATPDKIESGTYVMVV
jgi:hypothetical protein